jgi:hypothetical protein
LGHRSSSRQTGLLFGPARRRRGRSLTGDLGRVLLSLLMQVQNHESDFNRPVSALVPGGEARRLVTLRLEWRQFAEGEALRRIMAGDAFQLAEDLIDVRYAP